jgi:ABC-type branched-subunit amino acid transport system substrate-binding protein
MESNDGTYCEMTLLSVHYFRPLETDFSAHIADAKAAGARIFSILADAVTAARLLEQGYEAGLFKQGTQVFGSGSIVSRKLFQSFSSGADVASIMKGFIGLRLIPSYTVAHTTEGQAFMSRFRSQDSTAYGFNGLGEKTCDKSTDDDGGFYLYMMSVLNQTCAGLDFSTLYQNASNLDPYAALAYDAAYVVARGLHVLLYDQNSTTITGAALRQAIIDNVTFTGASGYIDIYEGMEYLG